MYKKGLLQRQLTRTGIPTAKEQTHTTSWKRLLHLKDSYLFGKLECTVHDDRFKICIEPLLCNENSLYLQRLVKSYLQKAFTQVTPFRKAPYIPHVYGLQSYSSLAIVRTHGRSKVERTLQYLLMFMLERVESEKPQIFERPEN